jgi:hypothetical protein
VVTPTDPKGKKGRNVVFASFRMKAGMAEKRRNFGEFFSKISIVYISASELSI